jgi:signal transduction histidine kinase
MAGFDPALFAAGGSTSLALATVLWALSQRRMQADARARLGEDIADLHDSADASEAAADAFDSVLIAVRGLGRARETRVAGGAHGLAACALVLGLATDAEPAEIVEALRRDPANDARLTALFERGEACDFEVAGQGPETGNTVDALRRTLTVEGRAAGALAWLRLTLSAASGLPSAARFAAFLDGLPHPAWITGAGGALVWANKAWLGSVDAATVDEAVRRGAAFDHTAAALASDAARSGQRREEVIRASAGGQRKAFQVTAVPLEGGGAAAVAIDVSGAEDAREQLRQHNLAHDQTLNRLDDAVALFGPDKRLTFHNTAFAELWGLEPAWLAEKPTHGEVLDRLRQRRRLPETVDYGVWKAKELAWYETLDAAPDELWSTPDGKTLKVVRQPHPFGGLLVLFADMTGEIRLRAQYNAQVQVQQATLDKLNDAVAVFGSDGRLRLHNEAFERFWRLSSASVTQSGDFDRLSEACLPVLPDRQFWRELKARVADPGPQARAPISGEVRTSDRRAVAWQTRPLPDGATLIAFSDITATRELEQAVEERSAALEEAQRLKRDFVGNVSYELRTPLTTIIGYAELLESLGEQVPERMRQYLGSVRTAAEQLARSIDDVLDMAQIDANEMALSLGDVRVADLLQQVGAEAERAAHDAGVRLVVEDAARAGVIRADEKRLAQTLAHLTASAIRTTPAGGEVRLSAVRADGEVQLSVRDTGRGIPFHIQAHIFDRFVGRDRGGPGLGLALVRALIELHGGWVALQSEPGNGALFTCHIPEQSASEAAPPELNFG